MGEQTHPSPTARPLLSRAAVLFWIAVWRVPLLDPAFALPDVDPVWPAVVGLTGFVTAYVAVLWTVFCWPPILLPALGARLGWPGSG